MCLRGSDVFELDQYPHTDIMKVLVRPCIKKEDLETSSKALDSIPTLQKDHSYKR